MKSILAHIPCILIFIYFGLFTAPVLGAETYGAFEGAGEHKRITFTEDYLQKIAANKQWINLLHFKKELLGYRSEADGSSFFLSKNGKYSELDELKATIDAFYQAVDPKDPDLHPICRFPARLMWLSRVLPLEPSTLPRVTCEKFNKFFNNISARSATVVFSSYYLNNPSSAFGHSFIRLNKDQASRAGERFSLLDYGINYAANAEQADPVSYAVRGILGFFPGTFTNVPYYYKVREYNDYEARDLWEYDLNLTQDQVALMTAHFWELGHTLFDYYYFTENCSYHVLTALEVANPELDLTERNPWVVIPSDTIRTIVNTPGLVKSIQYRPSVRAQFFHRVSLLTDVEREALSRFSSTESSKGVLDTLSLQQKARVLDAAMDYLDLKHPEEMVKDNSAVQEKKQGLLVERAALNVVSPALDIPAPARDLPHQGHGSRRAALYQLVQKTKGDADAAHATRLQYRFALHDLVDRGIGYPDYAQIEMFAFSGILQWKKQNQSTHFDLEEATFFKILSLNPTHAYDKKPSWKGQLSGVRFRDEDCASCFGMKLEAGGGWSVMADTFLGESTFFGLIEGELSAAPRFTGRHFRLAIGPHIGLRHRFNQDLSALFSYHYRYRPISRTHSDWSAEGELRWAPSAAYALGIKAQKGSVYDEVGFGFHYYY